MAQIVSLQCVKKRSGTLIHVQLDWEPILPLMLDPELCVVHKLCSGMNLSDALMRRLQSEQGIIEAKRRLLSLVAARRKTEREARQYLSRLKFEPEAIEAALQQAARLGYLNDSEYAAAYVRTRQREARRGPRLVRQELAQRGVAKEIAGAATAPLDEVEEQLRIASPLAEKRARQLAAAGETGQRRRQKFSDFLMRRGFTGEVVRRLSAQYLTGDSNHETDEEIEEPESGPAPETPAED